MIPQEVLDAIEEYAEEYSGNSILRDAVVHAAVFGYSVAQQQIAEKDKEIALLRARLDK
jgi:hypothetical protein